MAVDILSPRSDVIFKLFFADERNIELLTAFLKSILDIPPEEYDELSITDPHLLREYPDDKLGIIDVKLKTKTGKIINIEIQVAPLPQLRDRIIFYDAKMITEQIGGGEDYDKIKRVISVIITDHIFISESPSYHHRFVLYDPEHQVTFANTLEIYTLELPKIPGDSDGTPLWNWMKFLDARTEEDLHMIAERNPDVKKAVVRLIELSADEKARALYEAREKEHRDNRARERGAVKQRDFEIAKTMIADGEPIDKVTKYTGLTREEAEGLLQ